ncbi:NAD-dependent epimerase/dehydratase family protein [Novosphingobium lentum]|uniref:NAD-dependent epimerase/dehydratase family protein n=1 Tax=Novosphingobium lentum TaxID=145287 RepID=UPI0009FD069A|nr:NAD-dependent epimerase/dehydratase family protein [Novosphingobium lentum]
MNTFVIGANGYLGSHVAAELKAHGHAVSGLARSGELAAQLATRGVTPFPGLLTEPATLERIAREFDGIVFAPVVPFEEEGPALATLLGTLKGSGKPFLFTSGTGVLSIPAQDGAWHQESFAEDDPYVARHWLSLRVETENLVRAAHTDGVRAIVMRPPQIWGNGGSKQVPAIFESVEKTGAACYIGAGLNLYTHVHVEDLARQYRLAIETGTAGALYHAVAGEVNWRTLAEAVAQVMDCATRSVTYAEACDIWGEMYADLFFAVSSRSRCVRGRADLGWAPTKFDLVEDIRTGSYRAAYAPKSDRLA